MGGVKARLSHHLKRNRKPHWHIDYLLEKATIIDIGICETEGRTECNIAQSLGSQFDSIPDFGSSDCHCPSHLFFATETRQMQAAIMAAFKLLAIAPKSVELRDR